ncbi:FAD-binding protein [Gluconacetobacter azotocaptans]|uniref:FAD-binding protein n=1 Tax=Gluconacetobacter azotocaptans TaxID=142834 RepID=A0A7W4JVS8_9PROT|nr:FAD-linked oxidase C-terminal domain-containing protein [Gluconacetobacter azotocaptans]MBB2191831.1 FAD-binding protein [Gluconacetobacter azotocaptans]GBQ28999.1 FAD/FMN-containing dehydrogenase [Gluconacetobacter azotocaptans DSM 13594]
MRMPDPDQGVIARRGALAARLRAIVGAQWVLDDEAERRPYRCDGITAYQATPLLVVLPASTAEIRAVLAVCREQGVKIVPRGSGTSLSGGALPLEDGVLLVTSRLCAIVAMDVENRVARVQCGVPNIRISEAARPFGLCYMPDPSSQMISTIGGNVAENSGGVHCLKYGMTSNHVVGLEAVLMSGEVIRLGGGFQGAADGELDLIGLLTGSEGLLAVVTEITVRLVPLPEAARVMSMSFASVEDACRCVGAIIGAGIIPAGLEFMDRKVLNAVASLLREEHDPRTAALLLCELDGTAAEIDALIERVRGLAEQAGAIDIRASRTEEERERIWRSRKLAFSAIGKMCKDYYCTDGTIPRNRLPDILDRMAELSRTYGLDYANCFHAGDGNLHPIIMYDAARPGDLDKAEAFGADVLRACVDMGGVLSGEHGVGVEKRDLMTHQFAPADLRQQQVLKCAFDPEELLNPGKVFPSPCRCAEFGRMHVRGGEMRFPDIPRF